MVETLKEVPKAISIVNHIIIITVIIARNLMTIATTVASTGTRKGNAIAKREIITAEIGEMQDIGEEEIEDIPVGNVGKPIIRKLTIINYYTPKPHAQTTQKKPRKPPITQTMPAGMIFRVMSTIQTIQTISSSSLKLMTSSASPIIPIIPTLRSQPA